MKSRFELKQGRRLPCGATPEPEGVNFSIFSPGATAVRLALYGDERAEQPLIVLDLDPTTHRTFHFWHVLVVGAAPELFYTWMIDGPNDPDQGLRFDPHRELLDPWAREVSDAMWDRASSRTEGRTSIRARIPTAHAYDWEGDRRPERPLEDSIIYELHVGGFTRHPSAKSDHPGTFRALIDKIPYLVSLGITHVELLPIMAFDTQSVPPGTAKRGLPNYWGYDTYGFFAPHPAYGAGGNIRDEFRDLVKALHKAGLGVILDVVLNHTAEGDENGAVISFKGFVNEIFYHLEPEDRSRYRNYSGTGNTVNANHPFVAQYLLECLEYWATEMHVDGFRLDLASALSRDETGEPDPHAPVLWSMEFSEVLRDRRLIAEPWDAAGLYQVGRFPGFRWLEWNDKYRDAIRRYLRGDPGMVSEVATRLTGSSDLYAANDRRPTNSINFVTCHDGFTLYDLVAYEHKRNEPNGEDNRDGTDHSWSWNSGCEGPGDEAIERLRGQRARNFMTLLLLSQGVPMLLAGDEMLRTQRGNNNAYCQDNEISWLDWGFEGRHADMLRFTRELIAFRKRHPALRRGRFFAEEDDGPGSVRWQGEDAETPDWHGPDVRVMRLTLEGMTEAEPDLHLMMNMSGESVSLPVPPVKRAEQWHRVVDTSLDSPEDILASGSSRPLEQTGQTGQTYLLHAHAVAVLEAR